MPNDVALCRRRLFPVCWILQTASSLLALSKKLKTDGQVASCYLIFYSIGRFVLEYFRGDLIRGNVGEFSTSQFISLFICLIGLVLLLDFQFLQKRKELAHSRRNSAGFCIGKADFAGGNETGIFSWTSLPSASSSDEIFLMTQAILSRFLQIRIRRSMEVTSIIREALKFSLGR